MTLRKANVVAYHPPPQASPTSQHSAKAPNGVPEKLIKPWKLPPQKEYVFTNANVVDPVKGVVEKGQTVKLSGGRIEFVRNTAVIESDEAAVVVDLGGKYLCPGLIDCHVHLTSVAGDEGLTESLSKTDVSESFFRQPFLCKQILSRGFTTVRDTGGATLALKEAIADDVFPGPRVFTANKAISQTGGHGDLRGAHDKQCCGSITGISIVADGVPACIQAVREQLRTGADFIKILVGGGVASPTDKLESTQFTVDEIRAITEVAESAGTYVTAHAYTPKAIRHAIDNGVKGIEHGNFIDEDTAKLMARKGVWMTPTLVTYDAMGSEKYAGFLPPVNRAKNKEVLAKGVGSLKIAEAAGVTMCYGSDLLGPLQEEESREFGIRAQALSSKAILQAATINAAKMLKQEDFLGQIGKDFAADLVILNENPLKDISILDNPRRNVLAVMKNGRVYISRWQKLPEDVEEAREFIE